jgi:hypothetical protein
MQLRYVGFDQAKNIREYKFDGVAAGEANTHFVVSADRALFIRHHVGLQEGPALCLKKTLCRSGTAATITTRTYESGSRRLRIGSSCCCRICCCRAEN